MIYNIVQYFRDLFPNVTIFSNTKEFINNNKSIPEQYVLITETGGSETPWFQFEDYPFQIFCQDKDSPSVRALNFSFHEAINNKFGLILPEAVVDVVTYPQVITAQISVISKPQSLGKAENGRAQYSSNYKILMKGA